MFPRLQSGGSTTAWIDEAKLRPVVLPLPDEFTGDIARTLWMLAAAAGLVLLVAWANVVNLMLIRADGRQLELAVREALGAGRWRLASHFLGESVVPRAIAGVLALLLSHAAVRALVAFGPADIPRLAELGVGPTTVGFMALVMIAGVIICASVPTLRVAGEAFRVARSGLSSRLHDGGRAASTGKSRQRLRASITVLQIAMALTVTVGSALLLRTAHRLSEVHPGFDSDDVTTLRILLPYARYGGAENVAFFARLTDMAGQLPSVRAAGLTGKLPLGAGWTGQQTFLVEGGGATPSLPVSVVGNGYFAAMRIPVLAGRDFRPLDQAQSSDIIIGQRAAATLFGDPNGLAAVGKRLTLAPDGPSYTIVGVVGDVRYQDLSMAPEALIYRPRHADRPEVWSRSRALRWCWSSGRADRRARWCPRSARSCANSTRRCRLRRGDDERRGARVDGATFTDAGADGSRCGHHVAAGHDRPLRRDGLPGRAAHPRVRRARGPSVQTGGRSPAGWRCARWR
ncbi:MAG: ABC transporter permease [Rhodanobacteraceae bacterium]|nr:ABC transporter permease [Rhodanobacteraceae bacterium]